MTLLEQLRRHRGGLILIKTQLWWYGRGWDNNPGRVCLILDACDSFEGFVEVSTDSSWDNMKVVRVLLLIDSSLQWVNVDEGDVEILR